MKAFKLVLTGIAIAIYALLIGIKPTNRNAKELPAIRKNMQQDALLQCNKQAPLASPLCMTFHLPY